MIKKLLLLALSTCLLAGAANAQSFTPAVNAKKAPTEVQIAACKQEFEAKQIQANGYKAFMKNCLKRKVHPAQP